MIFEEMLEGASMLIGVGGSGSGEAIKLVCS